MTRRLVAAALAALLLTACGAAAAPGDHATESAPGQPASSSAQHHHHSGAAAAAAHRPAPVTGPQGRVAQFAVACPWSHRATADPIVHWGAPGRSHLHDFFGNTGTDAFSTHESLLAGATTCEQPLDTASYWAPALLDGGQPVTPERVVAYYRPAAGMDPKSLVAYPPGLKMLGGDPTATSAQPAEVVSWSCGSGTARFSAPRSCPDEPSSTLVRGDASGLRLWVTFPDCWDGVHVDSADHRSHMAYSDGGACPSDRPVAVPQLLLAIDYPQVGPSLELASGGVHSGHADFFNAWDQRKLETEVALCLGRGVVCHLAHSL